MSKSGLLVMKQINLQPEDTLYVLGDVVDRHPHGGRILRQLMKMPNVQLLLGNHEYMMLDALDRPFNEKDWHQEDEHRRYLYQWYRNGGDVTHAYLKHIKKELRREIFDYLRKLPVNITIEVNGIKYKLVQKTLKIRFKKLQKSLKTLINSTFLACHLFRSPNTKN